MSFVCELSGESLATSVETVVVTPSGHVCLKRLLLQKLAESGGKCPFSTQPLAEENLIELAHSTQKNATSIIMPPKTTTSFASLLTTLHAEYDALVLELFDTRKTLQETRQELSRALYENDAAVRVVARVCAERDQARQQVADYTKSGSSDGLSNNKNGAVATTTVHEPPTASLLPVANDESEPPSTTEQPPPHKKQKVQELVPLTNDIPHDDLSSMTHVWESLHQTRKASLKAAVQLSAEQLTAMKHSSKAHHKTKCKGLLFCKVSALNKLVVTAGSDHQVCVYDATADTVVTALSCKAIKCMDASNDKIVVVTAKEMDVYQCENGETIATAKLVNGSPLVDVRMHPDQTHIFGCSATQVLIWRLSRQESASTLECISIFTTDEAVEYTCGALHPDGLIYVAGTASGELHLWDIKNKCLASKMATGGDNNTNGAVVAIDVSENGYHIGACHDTGGVVVWDLRKQKEIVTLTELEECTTLCFDKSGKYLAYGGPKGIVITTAKEWGVTARYEQAADTGLVWMGSQLVATDKKDRKVNFFGISE
jgi:pre-mRNA-processing factor 19